MARTQTLIADPKGTGRILAVNRRRINSIPYTLLTNPPNNAVVVPANQATPMQIMMISGEGPAQIVSFSKDVTDNDAKVFLQIQDGTTPRGLMNGACHINTIFGSGQNPYYLPEALYIDELRSVQATFTDLSGASNTIRIAMNCGRHLQHNADPSLENIRRRMEAKQYLSAPHFYTFDLGVASLGVGATGQFTITVGQEHHFQIHTMSVQSDGLFDINIVDTQRGESIIGAPQDVNYAVGSDIIMGNANFPFRFHQPRLIQLGQRLVVTLTNRFAGTNNIFLTLGGRAITERMWR